MTKWIILLTMFSSMLLAQHALCQSRIAIGVRGGIVTDYDNPELVLPHKFDLKQLTMVGGHIQLGVFPVVTLELAVESNRRSDELTAFGEKVSAEIRDLTIAANIKYKFRVPVITPYIGGGVASHRLDYQFNSHLDYDALHELVEIPKSGGRFGMHGLAGIAAGFATSPVELFVEGRIGRIEGDDDSAHYTAVYGGITLRLL